MRIVIDRIQKNHQKHLKIKFKKVKPSSFRRTQKEI